MNLCTCLVFFNIFAITNSITKFKPRPHHSLLRTYVGKERAHNSEEFTVNTKNINKAHSFLATVVDGKDNSPLLFAPRKVETLTEFIQETVNVLNTYQDAAFKDFFHILDTEIRKYHYDGCRFSELMQNHNSRSLLSGALTIVKQNSATVTKANINEISDMLRDEIYDDNVRRLLNYIDSLYKKFEPEFRRILNNLKYYNKKKSKTTHNDLVQIVRDGVRTILFNRYTDLNTHKRRELKEKIENFWEKYKKNSGSHDATNSIYNRNRDVNNKHVFKTIEDRIHHHEPYSNDQNNFLRKRKKINVYHSDYDSESSIESGLLTTEDSAEEFPSGESFDTSTSIKHSQERHKEYNTERYMTLYTEEMSYNAQTTTKTDIPEKLLTKPKVYRGPVTTPRYKLKNLLPNKKNKIEDLRTNLEMEDAREDQATGTTKVLRSQYDAVIDVQLSNRDMLESLKKLEPKGTFVKDDTKRDMQDPHISEETINFNPKMRSENATETPKVDASNKSEEPQELRKSLEPEFNKTFNDYVKKKISTLEEELSKLKQMSFLRATDNDGKEKVNTTKKKKNKTGRIIPIKGYSSTNKTKTQRTTKISSQIRIEIHKVTTAKPNNTTTPAKNITDNTTNVACHNDTKKYANKNTFQIDTADLSVEAIRNRAFPNIVQATDSGNATSSKNSTAPADQIMRSVTEPVEEPKEHIIIKIKTPDNNK
ncbi:hypothetical protein PYW08_012077 [Mythimna loreyi]|uniref:Uncharacterized protein n=1 Tax=Mythimna loreyi TaxID=667449 RepID=A0ACC2PZC3_9NEOP|nr:hypothetical protein PYW08_012077 [Mythimna loreyi]